MLLNCEKQDMLFLEPGKLIAQHPGDGRAPDPELWPQTTLRSGSNLAVIIQLWTAASLNLDLGLIDSFHPATARDRVCSSGFERSKKSL